MSEKQALINACLADPDADLPKLLLADWLEDRGRGTEAWRIRQYLGVYRPEWQAVMRWGQPALLEHTIQLIHETSASLNHDLSRLLILTLLEAVESRFLLRLDRIAWEDGWDTTKFEHNLTQARCRLTLVACGLVLPLEQACQTVHDTHQLADRTITRLQMGEDGLLDWSVAAESDALRAAAAACSKARLVLLALGLERRPTHGDAFAERLVDTLDQRTSSHDGWSALNSLWKHIRDTDPGW